MSITNCQQIGSHCVPSTGEQVIVEDLLLFSFVANTLFLQFSQVSVQIIARIELNLLNGLWIGDEFHETDLFSDSDTLVASELEIEIDFLEKDVHQLKQHQNELVLSKVISILVYDASWLNFRLFLGRSLIDILAENSAL